MTKTVRYVIEPVPGSTSEWTVTISENPFIPSEDVVYTGNAKECVVWCEAQGATRKGPRVFVVEEQ